MIFLSARNFGLFVLGAFIVVDPTLARQKATVYNISVPKPPLGPLNVSLNYALATSWLTPQDVQLNNVRRNWHYSSHIVFTNRVEDSDKENPAISDGQL